MCIEKPNNSKLSHPARRTFELQPQRNGGVLYSARLDVTVICLEIFRCI